jgi:rare lipoprotein A
MRTAGSASAEEQEGNRYLAQDDYYYEIQLTNKQLVFYFMAGAAGLILSFLAGVMVGRGLENGAAGGDQARAVVEDKVVAEQTQSPSPANYSYPQRLESEKQPEVLEKPATTAGGAAPAAAPTRPAAAPTRPPATHAAATPAAPVATPTPAAHATTPAPAAAAHAAPAPASAGLPKPIGSNATVKGFAVQVGAFKDKASADGVVRSLRGRSLPAFTVAPAGHSGELFTVRVGVYRDRADAEAVQERLRDDKFKPFIIKQ